MTRGTAVHHVPTLAADALATCGTPAWSFGSIDWVYVDCANCLKRKPAVLS